MKKATYGKYSSSQADYIHEATFRAQGFGKFADRCKEEGDEELEEVRNCTKRVIELGGQPVIGYAEKPIFSEIKDLLKDWADYACPFCYIGETALKQAIKNLGLGQKVHLEMKAFEFDPDGIF